MILGILSDSHGKHQRVARAIQLLQGLGAEAFIHCGDVCGEQVFDQLAGLRAWFVWGNTDDRDPVLERYVESLGLPLPQTVPLRVALDGREIAVFHGHESEFARLPAFAAGCRYVLHGHTHVARDVNVGPLRVINPGALHRAPVYSVATLDLQKDEVKFWRVDETGNSAVSPQMFFSA